jgi:hypothetical protein
LSYESENTLPRRTRLDAVVDFLKLLGYERFRGSHPLRVPNVIDFGWYSDRDYESSTRVEASVGRKKSGEVYVYTRTAAARSYHDHVHQNRTIREVRLRFGGFFETDAGRNRCWSTKGLSPLPPQARGVIRAYSRFKFSAMQTYMYRNSVSVSPDRKKVSGIDWMDRLNPMILANNLLLPFQAAAVEDFFKSCFVALLRYSSRKDIFFKGARLVSANLSRVSDGAISIEEAIAESLPFQNIVSICEHFKTLDPKLDLAGVLRRPYRRRRESLFDSLSVMLEKRHALIHRNIIDTKYTDDVVERDVDNLKASTERCVRRMNIHYGWNLSDWELLH